MAKYSRSALSMKQSLRELNAQRAEQFLNTFYFQYGHRSIADLAHIAFAVERLSLLAAIVLVDEQRWDGQERSTRYQDFKKSGWYLPAFGSNVEARQLYTQQIEALFSSYDEISRGAVELLRSQVAKPEEMKQEAYDRTLRARAFDGARYLLPLAANTSLGEIVNARTLETQVSRLLSQPHAEVRRLGEKLREAAASPCWSVQRAAFEDLQRDIAAADPALGERAAALLLRDVAVAPTLVKYAAPVEYIQKSRIELEQAALDLMNAAPIQPRRSSIWSKPTAPANANPSRLKSSPPCSTAPATIPTARFAIKCAALDAPRREELLLLGTRHRGRHDELSRAFSSGYQLRFDILMDIGGFRDMHRHRRCVQTIQSFTNLHGYDVPELIADSNLRQPYEDAVRKAHAAFDTCPAPTFQRRKKLPNIFCRWEPVAARSSRWISRKLSTLPNCAARPRATSPTAASPGKCMKPSPNGILSWQRIFASPTSTSPSTPCSGSGYLVGR